MNITETKIEFQIYMWRSVYIIKSQFGHYLGKDGHIHDDADSNCQWETRSNAEKFLADWDSRTDFSRIDTLTLKG